MNKLKEEAREAAAADMEASGYNSTALAIRRGSTQTYHAARAVAAALAVIDGYEEVKVGVDARGDIFPIHLYTRAASFLGPTTIYIKKKEPEPVTLSRKSLAVLTEYVKDIPNKDMVLDTAMAEATKALD